MQKRFVNELEWLDEEEMLDLVAIAQSSPGPIAVNTSIIVGYRMAGILGSLITVVGTVLPPLIIISTISYFYEAFRENPLVNALLLGMQAGIAAVIVNVVINMAAQIVEKKQLTPIVMMILAFIATLFLDVNIIVILVICGAVGAYTSLHGTQKKEEAYEQ